MIVHNFGEGIAIALDAIRANKLRSTLTILGVVIGVTTVMAVYDWRLALVAFSIVPLFLPLMRRVRVDPPSPRSDGESEGERVAPLPAPVE